MPLHQVQPSDARAPEHDNFWCDVNAGIKKISRSSTPQRLSRPAGATSCHNWLPLTPPRPSVDCGQNVSLSLCASVVACGERKTVKRYCCTTAPPPASELCSLGRHSHAAPPAKLRCTLNESESVSRHQRGDAPPAKQFSSKKVEGGGKDRKRRQQTTSNDDNKGRQRTTKDDKGRQWTTKDDKRRQRTTKDDKGRQTTTTTKSKVQSWIRHRSRFVVRNSHTHGRPVHSYPSGLLATLIIVVVS